MEILENNKPGIYVVGMVISNSANLFKTKDGKETVRISSEIAIQPGLAKFDRYMEPTESGIQINNGELVEFPKLEEFQPVVIKAAKIREYNGQISVSGEVVE